MKVVILTQYFPPDTPGWIPNDIANDLCSRGHEVRVLTSFPHFANGKIANGYKQQLHHIENVGGIQVRRVPIFPSHSANPIGRVANYLSFSYSARMAKSFVEGADVIYVHGTPATVVEPARVWSENLGIPYVYHVQDIWPESVTESGFLPRRVAKIQEALIGRWLDKVYRGAAAVNAIAPTAQHLLVQRGVPENRCHLVFNWAYERAEGERSAARGSTDGPGLTLLYAGTLGGFQDLETVIKAAQQLRDFEGFRLLIAGTGVAEDRLKKLVDDLQAGEYVTFLGRRDRDHMGELYAVADFQVVSLKDLDFFAGTIPSKFQAGLAHGLPLITTVKGDVTRLVDEHGLGFSASPENVEALAAAFRRAYATTPMERQEYSRRARAFYEENLSRKAAIDRIESILIEAAGLQSVAVRQ